MRRGSKSSLSRIDKFPGVTGKQRPNPGAEHCAHESKSCAQATAREARAKLALVTATRSRTDNESSSKSDKRAHTGGLAPSPSAVTVPLYLEHVLFSCGHRPDRHVLRRPVLECTGRRSRFQGQANSVPWLQLSKG